MESLKPLIRSGSRSVMTPTGKRTLLSAKDLLPLWTHLFLTLPPHLFTPLWYIFYMNWPCPSPFHLSLSIPSSLTKSPSLLLASLLASDIRFVPENKKRFNNTAHMPAYLEKNMHVQYFSCRRREAQCLVKKEPLAHCLLNQLLGQYISWHAHGNAGLSWSQCLNPFSSNCSGIDICKVPLTLWAWSLWRTKTIFSLIPNLCSITEDCLHSPAPPSHMFLDQRVEEEEGKWIHFSY